MFRVLGLQGFKGFWVLRLGFPQGFGKIGN